MKQVIAKQSSDENKQFNCQLGYFRDLIGLVWQSNFSWFLISWAVFLKYNNTPLLLPRKLAEDHTQFVGNVFTKHQEESMQSR